MPSLWPGVKAYYVLVAYILAPIFAFCNAYGMGLTDWSLLTTYGKVCIFLFAAWGGVNGGGIIAGLATATAMAVIVGAAADLMQVCLSFFFSFFNSAVLHTQASPLVSQTPPVLRLHRLLKAAAALHSFSLTFVCHVCWNSRCVG